MIKKNGIACRARASAQVHDNGGQESCNGICRWDEVILHDAIDRHSENARAVFSTAHHTKCRLYAYQFTWKGSSAGSRAESPFHSLGAAAWKLESTTYAIWGR